MKLPSRLEFNSRYSVVTKEKKGTMADGIFLWQALHFRSGKGWVTLQEIMVYMWPVHYKQNNLPAWYGMKGITVGC